jgi:hypothetical protein
MTPIDYVYCGILALLGLLFAVLLQLKAQSDKARMANLIVPTFKSFVKDEYLTILISLVVIIISMFLTPFVIEWKPSYAHFIRPAYLPIGYMGTDILLKLFGRVSKWLNAAIDMKTNIADTDPLTGKMQGPTPALPPQKTDSSPKI